jgi:hypothetical protein
MVFNMVINSCFFVLECMVAIVENFSYYVFYFCCWHVSVHVFNVKGTKFCIFVFLILRIQLLEFMIL